MLNGNVKEKALPSTFQRLKGKTPVPWQNHPLVPTTLQWIQKHPIQLYLGE
jgi:hypothetical protein